MRTRPLEPSDIFLGETESPSMVAQAGDLARNLQDLVASGTLDDLLPMARSNPVAVFALGAVGGALGARYLKGTLGFVAGAGLAYWAWQELSGEPETLSQASAASAKRKKKKKSAP